MKETIDNKKLPWPSRLGESSFRFSKLGIIICVLGIPAAFLGELGALVIILGAGVILLGFFCSIISFVGLLCYRFKAPGTSKVVLVGILSCPVLALALAIEGPSLERAYYINTHICKNNLDYLSNAVNSYYIVHDSYPSKSNWPDLITPYIHKRFSDDVERNIYLCPKDKLGPCSYAMNENIPANLNKLPDDMVLLFESSPGLNQTGGLDDVVTNRHKKSGANIGFANGHVRFVKTKDISTLRWTVEE